MFRALVLLTLLPLSAFAEGKASTHPDALAVDQACAADAQTAGCGSAQVGSGLLKCLHAYKKEHKDFHFSNGCKAALKQAREHKRAAKAEQEKAH